jgi:hypothetical protein
MRINYVSSICFDKHQTSSSTETAFFLSYTVCM